MTEIRLFDIKAFDSKDRGDVIIVGLFVLPLIMAFLGAIFGGDNTHETYNTIYIAKYDISDANKYLINIDQDIMRHISSVNVIDRRKAESICNGAAGCAIINTMNGKPTDANIYLSNNFDGTGYSFEYVFYHEVGHVEAAFKIDLSASSEGYANRFADRYTKKEALFTTIK